MALPASFKQHGFVSAVNVRPARSLMLSLEGVRDTGKTEFSLSAPGPGIVLCLDRGFDAVLDNAEPPPTRRDDFGFKVIKVPKLTSATQDQFKQYWTDYRTSLYAALDNPDARTTVMDGEPAPPIDGIVFQISELLPVHFGEHPTVNAVSRAGTVVRERLWTTCVHNQLR
jgi:hypothetical protein